MCTPGWLVGRRAPAVRRDDAFAWRLSLSAARAAPTTSWRRYVLALALADRNPPARCATSLLSRPRGRPPAAQRPARGDRRAQRPVGLRQAGVGASVPRLPSRRGSRRSRAAHPAPPHRPWRSGIVERRPRRGGHRERHRPMGEAQDARRTRLPVDLLRRIQGPDGALVRNRHLRQPHQEEHPTRPPASGVHPRAIRCQTKLALFSHRMDLLPRSAGLRVRIGEALGLRHEDMGIAERTVTVTPAAKRQPDRG
jgi:hypothetical protein